MQKKRARLAALTAAALFIGITGFTVHYMRNADKYQTQQLDTVYTDQVSTLCSLSSTGTIQQFSGVIEPQTTWSLQRAADKTISEIHVQVGDTVHVGDALVTYDSSDDEDSLKQAEIDAQRLSDEIASSTTELEKKQKEKAKAAASEQLEYSTQIQELQNKIKKDEYDLKKKQTEMEKLKTSIAGATAVSELEGVVRKVDESNSSDDSDTLITVAAEGSYRIKGNLNEQDKAALNEGDAVIIRSREDSDLVLTGKISSIDFQNPIQTSSDDSSSAKVSFKKSCSYSFYVELDDIDELFVGEHVYIERDHGQTLQRSGIWLSSCYILQDGDQAWVWAANDRDKLEKRAVTLGDYDEHQEQYEIKDGLTRDDYIAFPGSNAAEGAPVVRNIDRSGSSSAGQTEEETA